MEFLTGKLADAGCVTDGPGFGAAVLGRERIAATWLGHGVAMPHARTDLARSLSIAVGTSEAGIPWPNAAQSARIIVLVAIPPAEIAGYLSLVRRIMGAVAHPERRARLVAAESDETLMRAWGEVLR